MSNGGMPARCLFSTKEFLMVHFVAYSKPILPSVKFASCWVVPAGIPCPAKCLSWISCHGSIVCSHKLRDDVPGAVPVGSGGRRWPCHRPGTADTPQLQLRPRSRGDGLLRFSVLRTVINIERGFPVLGRGGRYCLAYLSPLCSNTCNPAVAVSDSRPAMNALGWVFSPSCLSFSKALPGLVKSSSSSHHFVPLVCTASTAGPAKRAVFAKYVLSVPIAFQDPSVCRRFSTAASLASHCTLGRGLLSLLA